MNGVYKFCAYFGRMGELNGVFVANEYEIDKLMGQTVYFGEALGKHSDIHCVITEENTQLITQDETIIQLFLDNDLTTGFNPLDYVDDDD